MGPHILNRSSKVEGSDARDVGLDGPNYCLDQQVAPRKNYDLSAMELQLATL